MKSCPLSTYRYRLQSLIDGARVEHITVHKTFLEYSLDAVDIHHMYIIWVLIVLLNFCQMKNL